MVPSNIHSKHAVSPKKQPLVRKGIMGSGPAGLITAIALEHYLSENLAIVTLLD